MAIIGSVYITKAPIADMVNNSDIIVNISDNIVYTALVSLSHPRKISELLVSKK